MRHVLAQIDQKQSKLNKKKKKEKDMFFLIEMDKNTGYFFFKAVTELKFCLNGLGHIYLNLIEISTNNNKKKKKKNFTPRLLHINSQC